MNALLQAMAAADAIFADISTLVMQPPDERYGYKKVGGDSDAPRTQDVFN